MTNEVIWTKIVLERFIEQANLSEDEENVIRTRAATWSLQVNNVTVRRQLIERLAAAFFLSLNHKKGEKPCTDFISSHTANSLFG